MLRFSVLVGGSDFNILFCILLISCLVLHEGASLLLLLVLYPMELRFFLILSFSVFLMNNVGSEGKQLGMVTGITFLCYLYSMVTFCLRDGRSLLTRDCCSRNNITC